MASYTCINILKLNSHGMDFYPVLEGAPLRDSLLDRTERSTTLYQSY